jgi:hypothetical protein
MDAKAFSGLKKKRPLHITIDMHLDVFNVLKNNISTSVVTINLFQCFIHGESFEFIRKYMAFRGNGRPNSTNIHRNPSQLLRLVNWPLLSKVLVIGWMIS